MCCEHSRFCLHYDNQRIHSQAHAKPEPNLHNSSLSDFYVTQKQLVLGTEALFTAMWVIMDNSLHYHSQAKKKELLG